MVLDRLSRPILMPAYPASQRASNSLPKNICISLLVAAALCVPGALSSQQTGDKTSFGIAWRVIGQWHISGRDDLMSEGDALAPGALLKPLAGAQNHSVTVLLPDGQRVLYECFTTRDCERGFRVPSLYRNPSPIAIDLLSRVNAVMLKKDAHIASSQADEPAAASDETAVIVNAENRVEVAGLAASLSDGSYSYEVQPIPRGSGQHTRGIFEKHGRSISLTVQGEGLFDVLIYDRLKTPRIDLLLAAMPLPRGEEMVKSFEDIGALLKDWNEDYQGWPVHELRRAYLRSVILGIEPRTDRKSRRSSAHAEEQSTGVTCEPKFEPAPGVFKVDTEVRLQCGSPNATIYYTVDGSQPLEGATAYRAPIVVKGTALMIKAFASAPGKKDSPVVTGIYRIGE